MTHPAPSSRLLELRRIAAQHADSPQVLFELGNELLAAAELDEAIGCYRQALALRPDFPDAYNNMGVALKRAGKFDDAILAFGSALNLRLDYADAHGNLGNALLARGQIDSALTCYRRALRLRPDAHGMYNNLANALCASGDMPQAMLACQQSLALKPDYPEAHLSLGLMLLLQGDMENGWREYEWRWQSKEHQTPAPTFHQPRWDGGDLQGKRILLHCEQALGDTLQFARYAPLVQQRGGKVLLACQEELVSLLRNFEGVETVLNHNAAMPPFDVHLPLLSLPAVFNTTLNSIPAAVPYLHPDPGAAQKWQTRLAGESRRKIGLVWAGRPAYSHDRERSITLSLLAPLAIASNAAFFSLQKGDAAKQTARCPFPITDWTSELNNFSDTAALIQNLDLVISVDTAVAHLAGAMGKPVWLLLKYIPDWRWMLHRPDSPWYPTMRLFRQPAIADWTSPIAQAAQALRSL